MFWIFDQTKYPDYLNITLFSFLWSDWTSVTKIKWNWYPMCQIWPKNGRFQGNSRVSGNSWKIPGMMDFINSTLKIKFFDKNWVGKIPYTLKLARSWPFPGNIHSSRKILEVSRKYESLKFRVENQVSWHKLSGINTLHVEISQN